MVPKKIILKRDKYTAFFRFEICLFLVDFYKWLLLPLLILVCHLLRSIVQRCWKNLHHTKRLSRQVSIQHNLITHWVLVTKMVDERQIPHFLLYGPPGTGKTTTILAMAHRLFGPKDYRSYVVEVRIFKSIFLIYNIVFSSTHRTIVALMWFETISSSLPRVQLLILTHNVLTQTFSSWSFWTRQMQWPKTHKMHLNVSNSLFLIFKVIKFRCYWKVCTKCSFLSHLQSLVKHHTGYSISLH